MSSQTLSIRGQHIVDVEVYFGWSCLTRRRSEASWTRLTPENSPDRSSAMVADAHVSTRLPANDLERLRKFYTASSSPSRRGLGVFATGVVVASSLCSNPQVPLRHPYCAPTLGSCERSG
jgi:hypothetical protein